MRPFADIIVMLAELRAVKAEIFEAVLFEALMVGAMPPFSADILDC